jgi:hypothetical protein
MPTIRILGPPLNKSTACVKICGPKGIISFTRKTNSTHFNYFLGDLLNVRTGCVKDLGVMLDSKLHLHRRVDCLHVQALKLLGLIRFII